MIRKIQIRNFKSLRDVSIDLERFTVFVGPNASGKSSILQGLDVLCRAFSNPDSDVEIEVARELSHGSKQPVELVSESSANWCRYRARSLSAQLNPQKPKVWLGDGKGINRDFTAAGWKRWMPGQDSIPLPYSVLLRLEASKLVLPTPLPADQTVMTPDGTGLHSTLAGMALNDPDSWQELQADLRRIIPTIRRLRHTKSTAKQPAALLFDTVGADSLPSRQVSEGTLLVLGLLTAFHGLGRPTLILLDDLDRGLHPKAQKDLISLLRGLLATNSELQIIATTHSPYMLDCMEPNEVRMTFLRDDGSTVCAALASHPKFEKWKDEMTPGELWSLFGEKWLIEQEIAT